VVTGVLGRLFIAWLTVGRTFGSWLAPLGTFVLLSLLRASVAIGMFLDPIVRPALRRARVDRPIVIVGNPRSGTTFLHRFLVEQRVGAGLALWEMLYPSLLLRSLLRPLLPLLERISPARHHSTVAHDTSLTSVETDDVSIMFRYFDGFFLYGFLLAWAEQDYRRMFEPSSRDTSVRDFAWLERLWRDNAFAHGADRVVAKLFSLGMRMPRFLERFPDARVLYMVRDPLQVIPSGLSLVTGVLDKRFGFWRLPPPTRERYIRRLYDALVLLLRTFHDDWTAGRIPRERVLIVRFDRMMADFETVAGEILAFTGVAATPELSAEIVRVAGEQRRFASQHRYDAAKFGIDEGTIRRDCAFVYETFLDGSGAGDHPPGRAVGG
jgi:hypothetical protein